MISNKIFLVTPLSINQESSSSRYIKNYIDSFPTAAINYPVKKFLLFNPKKTNKLGRAFNKLCSRLKLYNLIRLKIYELFIVEYHAKDLLRQLSDQDRLWILLCSPEIAILSNYLLKKKKVNNMSTSLLDLYDYQLNDCLSLFRRHKRYLRAMYVFVLATSAKVASMGQNMNLCLTKDGIDPSNIICMPPVLVLDKNINDLIPVHTSSTLHLAFAGNLYAKDAWNKIVRSIDHINTYVDDRQIYIHHFGARPMHGVYKSPQVIQHGFLPYTDLGESLNECDLALLPYEHTSMASDVFMTSFPSKLLTYMASNLPVIYLGSSESEPAKFIRQHNIGFVFDSGEIDSLERLIAEINIENIHNLRTHVRDICVNLFSNDSRHNRLQELLQLP